MEKEFRRDTHSAEVANTNLQGHTCTPLVAAGQIVGEPSDKAGKGWVNGARGYEDTAIYHSRIARSYTPISNQSQRN